MQYVQKLSLLALFATMMVSPKLFAQKKAAAAAPAKAAPAKTSSAKPTGIHTSTAAKGTAGTTAKVPITTANHGATTAKAPITTANHGAATAGPITTGAKSSSARVPGAAPHVGAASSKVGNLHAIAPSGSHDRVAPNGSAVRVRSNGRPADVHNAQRGMDIHHNLAGGRRVEVERADHSRLTYDRGRRGFIAHRYGYHGHDFYRRSYYYHGRAYDRFYNHYGYRGLYLDVYAPYRFYPFGFYGWAYNPWAAPVTYAWGFDAAPWYGYYGAYFAPYPVYGAPSLWLTDYVISDSLATAYDARVANQGEAEATGNAPPTPLTPQTKQLVANEVQGQIALESAEAHNNAQHQDIDPASSSIARMLGDGQPHVFIAGKEVDLTDSNGQECPVTEGDVLQLRTPPAPDATSATLVVIASKGGGECRGQTVVSVPLDELQEMQNHMRETVDQGMAELQAKQGTNGLPPAPASATAPPVVAAIAENAPPPDPGGAQALEQQAILANQSEKEVLAATAAAPGPSGGDSLTGRPSPPPTETAKIALGQPTAEVVESLGQPLRILNLGPKTVYVYKDMKITFRAGKVSNVE
jgi:hypothetical protein